MIHEAMRISSYADRPICRDDGDVGRYRYRARHITRLCFRLFRVGHEHDAYAIETVINNGDLRASLRHGADKIFAFRLKGAASILTSKHLMVAC